MRGDYIHRCASLQTPVRLIVRATFCSLIAAVCAFGQANGVITGKVINEDGGGAANVTVNARPVGVSRSGIGRTVSTDEEGNFRFTGLAPQSYAVTTFGGQGYTRSPLTPAERREPRYYRAGDHATLTLIKGGVITGRVTDAAGEPMINVGVLPHLVRDADGYQVRSQFGGATRMTDDRGVYRLYGLPPGTYVVSINGSQFFNSQGSPYAGEAATYYPSSRRETAGEIKVMSGGEAAGADIRYRGEPGRVVSGVIIGGESGTTQSMSGINVTVYTSPGGQMAGQTFVTPGERNQGFSLYGLTDGEYELTASRGAFENQDGAVSPPRRVSIKGADVSGVELRLAPLAAISGKVLVESAANLCESKSTAVIREIVLTARRDDPSKNASTSLGAPVPFSIAETAVDDRGEFKFYFLSPNRYRLEARLPNENWYLKSMTVANTAARAGAARGGAPVEFSRSGLSLKSGEKLTGATLTVAEGAASVQGKIVPASPGASLPARLRVHLIPSEPVSVDDLLRYAETPALLAAKDGGFSFRNLPPGKYWLLARIVSDDEQIDRSVAPVAWDATERAKLRKDAAAKMIEVELKPCQKLSGFELKY